MRLAVCFADQHVKGDIWSKKNAGVSDRASRDLAQKEEEDNVMERSRFVVRCILSAFCTHEKFCVCVCFV